MQFVAISGPTYDQFAPFQWSTSDFKDNTPHMGHPDTFKFDPVVFDGTTDFKPFQRKIEYITHDDGKFNQIIH